MERRVVITGVGVVTPVGNTVKEFWDNLVSGRSGIDRVKSFDPSHLPSQIAGEVKNFDPKDYFEPKEARKLDRFTQLGFAAAYQAVKDAGVDFSHIRPADAGVVTGAGIGGINTLENQHRVLLNKGERFVSPFLIPAMIPDMLPGCISMRFGIRGPNYSVSSACASSAHAIGLAYRHIKNGDVSIIITGGAESTITPLSFAGFCNMRALSTRNDAPQKASRPFDKNRDGFVMAEGAGILVLEDLEHAMKRNAKIYAEIAGFGFSGDAYHMTAPDPEGKGQIEVMETAIASSGLKKSDIQYINAHGTSTPLNDKIETKAIKAVFGELAKEINISSTKSVTGHLLGAAGAVEAIALTLTITEKVIPPTINYEEPDPECDLNYTPNKPVEKEIFAGLTNSFGFGGHNATIVIKKFE
ncbi:MAG: beta-ketoacyl-[acyl-carrier-protein] synthase II [Candidatus Neomarinimicrobiota bacterium]|nr:MAG: beta-ketoacyl-[acyl-carrier-protein] synthase II [Candidatus Neomarinimicrobiota bacterium]